MSSINNKSQNTKQFTDTTKNTHTQTEKPDIYTLENLIQTLEEAANYLAFQ
ncbi:MAG: serine dehydratase [Nostocales cyanobacterium]|nr:MAG: serine dehydratase [Nostocales cyanobacterium]TAF16144.1 MAG: serine dehydratase [Nostocales cyanobacterium]